MTTHNGDGMARAFRAAPGFVARAMQENRKPAVLGWQKSDTEVVVEAPGGLGELYITWSAKGTRDTARRGANIPLAPLLPVLVERIAEVNYIVDIDWSDPRAVLAVLNNSFGVLPHAASHQHGGTDELATATPAANAIPKADGSGLLDGWVTPAALSGLSDVLLTTLTNDEVLAWDATAGKWVNVAQAGALVTSVNGQTGAVVLNADHIDDSTTTHKFASSAELTKLAGIETGANLYVHPNHSGDITSVGDGATTIAADVVTNAKLANVATATIKGRTTAGAGDPEDLTATEARAVLNIADSADNTASTISGAATDDTIADADVFGYLTGGVLVKTAWSNIKATLTTLFDAAYLKLTGGVLRRTSAGMLLDLGTFSITEGANTFGTGFLRGSSDDAMVLTIVRAAANQALMGAGVNGDTFRRFVQLADGTLEIGSGSAARDTNLYRNSANHLKTDDDLIVAGDLSAGVDAALGKMHLHDGTGGSLFVTKTGVNGTAQTIIPNGTGDVERHCIINCVMWATDGSHSRGFNTAIANNSSVEVFPDAPTNANGVTLVVGSGGALTIQRTTGSKTYNFAGHIVWL